MTVWVRTSVKRISNTMSGVVTVIESVERVEEGAFMPCIHSM